MKKWEYRIVSSKKAAGGSWYRRKSREALEAYLNELGAEGWELIGVDWNEFEDQGSFAGVAKREKVEGEQR